MLAMEAGCIPGITGKRAGKEQAWDVRRAGLPAPGEGVFHQIVSIIFLL